MNVIKQRWRCSDQKQPITIIVLYAALELGPRFLPGPLTATLTNRRLY